MPYRDPLTIIQLAYFHFLTSTTMAELNRCTEKRRKKQKIKVSKQQVEKWLSKELSYTLNKPVRKRFSPNKTIVLYIDELW